MQECRAYEPGHQRGVFDGIPCPVAAPAEDLVGPAPAQHDAEGDRVALRSIAARGCGRPQVDDGADPPSFAPVLEPDQLGLGEYLDQVDPEQLRSSLQDVRDVVIWERSQGKTSGPVARGVSLNLMVKELSDLRPGMEMTGLVANLTHFGAFVELGLSIQGMIHLSELSDTFIKHPSEKVQVGDRVRVRILEVDLNKRRLSLSMRKGREGSRMKARDKRVASLKALDGLFKK